MWSQDHSHRTHSIIVHYIGRKYVIKAGDKARFQQQDVNIDMECFD